MIRTTATRNFFYLLFALLFSACAMAPAQATPQLPVRDLPTPAATASVTPAFQNTGIRVEFFNNMRLEGTPAFARVDPNIDFAVDTWAYPAEGIGSDFSARWTGFIVPPTTDTYVFSINADDGVRFIFDGMMLIDDWDTPTYEISDSDPVILEAGKRYPITIELYDQNGDARLQLSWRTVSGIFDAQTAQIVPAVSLTVPDGPVPVTLPKGTRAVNDVCIPDLTLASVQYSLGTYVAPSTAIPITPQPPSAEEAPLVQVSPDDVVGSMEPNTYRVLVVPVGYSQDEIASMLPERIRTVQSITDSFGLGVTYAYVNAYVPVQVDLYGDLLRLEYESARAVVERVKTFGSPHLIVFEVNSFGRPYSTSIDGIPVNVISKGGYLYSYIHEQGHKFGLSDGYYDSVHKYGTFLYSSTELFIQGPDGNPLIKNVEIADWVYQAKPAFEDSGFVCLGDTLVRMVGVRESIMHEFWDDSEFFLNGSPDPRIFTSFQLWRMHKTRAEILAQNP